MALRRIKPWKEYESYFVHVTREPVVCEASVAYLFHPDSPDEIRRKLGDNIRIIMFIRNPVDMAYSLWGHMRRLEREPLSFQAAIDAIPSRRDGVSAAQDWVGNYMYVDRARFVPQINRYRLAFGADNVFIRVFEQMVQAPQQHFNELFEWLGMKPMAVSEFPRQNVAGKSRSRRLRRLLDGRSSAKRLLKQFTPAGPRASVRRIIEQVNRKAAPLPPMSNSIRQ